MFHGLTVCARVCDHSLFPYGNSLPFSVITLLLLDLFGCGGLVHVCPCYDRVFLSFFKVVLAFQILTNG